MDSETIFTSQVAAWGAFAFGVLYLLYRYGTAGHDFFESQGIKGPKPLPFIGNAWGLWKINMPKYDTEMVKTYGKVLGLFDGPVPNLWVTDIELIKSIFVKDFDHFVNRRAFPIHSRVIRKMISIMYDQEWKDVRTSITPAFTTGKIKRMSVLITECANRLAAKFEKIAADDGKFNAKTQFSAFTMDVIARCALGMRLENLGEKDDLFLEKAKRVFSPQANKSPLMLILAFPGIITRFGERMFLAPEFQFFIKIIEDVIEQRKNSKEKYNDFIELATESIADFTKVDANGEKVPMWTRDEVDEIVAAQSVLFLLAGFDTTATTLTNTIFLLARHPDIQQKLYKEVKEKLEQHEEVNHEMVLDFPYIDHIINESLRVYPPVLRIERSCTKDFTYKGVHFKKGMTITVPTFALHYDGEHYPEPEVFNPDRWSADSPIKPSPYAFMPFGMGPRNCIAMRFAMEEIKIALCTIVNRFRFFPVAETPERMVFEDGWLTICQPIHATVGIEVRS